MKKLEKKIERLIELIEFGIYTRKEAFYQIRSLKGELDEMFEQGTDKHQTLLYLLIDAHNLTEDTLI